MKSTKHEKSSKPSPATPVTKVKLKDIRAMLEKIAHKNS